MHFIEGKLYRITRNIWTAGNSQVLRKGDVAMYIERKAHWSPEEVNREAPGSIQNHQDYVFLNKVGDVVSLCWVNSRPVTGIFEGPL